MTVIRSIIAVTSINNVIAAFDKVVAPKDMQSYFIQSSSFLIVDKAFIIKMNITSIKERKRLHNIPLASVIIATTYYIMTWCFVKLNSKLFII